MTLQNLDNQNALSSWTRRTCLGAHLWCARQACLEDSELMSRKYFSRGGRYFMIIFLLFSATKERQAKSTWDRWDWIDLLIEWQVDLDWIVVSVLVLFYLSLTIINKNQNNSDWRRAGLSRWTWTGGIVRVAVLRILLGSVEAPGSLRS